MATIPAGSQIIDVILNVTTANDDTGTATVVAYSVMYNKGTISHAIAFCDTPAGARTVVRTDDGQLAERMTREEFVGRAVQVNADGSFAVAAAP